jgi:hypothetical protein
MQKATLVTGMLAIRHLPQSKARHAIVSRSLRPRAETATVTRFTRDSLGQHYQSWLEDRPVGSSFAVEGVRQRFSRGKVGPLGLDGIADGLGTEITIGNTGGRV